MENSMCLDLLVRNPRQNTDRGLEKRGERRGILAALDSDFKINRC